jgi:hypothetical protein
MTSMVTRKDLVHIVAAAIYTALNICTISADF